MSAIEKGNVESYGGCLRRWRFRYVERLPEPTTVKQDIGIKGHAQAQHYLSTGEDVLGPMMRAGKHLMPVPGPDLLVEQPFGKNVLTAAGVSLVGFMDLVNPRGEYVTPEGLLLPDPKGTVEVVDHKTTSNLGYAKDAEAIASSTQMVGYGEWARRKFPGLEAVRLSHIYYQTNKPFQAVKRTSLVSTELIESRWEKVEAVVEQLKEVAKKESWEEVPGNPEACTAYKGCPFRNLCHKAPKERIHMSLLSKVRGAFGANGATAAVAAALPPPAPVAAAAPPPPAPPPAAGIVPPDAPKTQLASPAPAPAPQVAQAPASPPPAAEAKPDVKKSKKKLTLPATASETVQTAATLAAETKGIRLFINAVPNGGFETLDGYIREALFEMEKQFGVPDIRCAPDANSPLAYAKWKGVLAALVKAKPPAPGDYVVFTRGNEFAEVVAEALGSLKLLSIVRGV